MKRQAYVLIVICFSPFIYSCSSIPNVSDYVGFLNTNPKAADSAAGNAVETREQRNQFENNQSPNENASTIAEINAELQKQRAEVNSLQQTVDEVLPAVNRMMEMESEVGLFLDHIALVSDLSSNAFIDQQAFLQTEQAELKKFDDAQAIEIDQTTEPVFNEVTRQDKFHNMNTLGVNSNKHASHSINTKPSVPVEEAMQSLKKYYDDKLDAKFSNQSAANFNTPKKENVSVDAIRKSPLLDQTKSEEQRMTDKFSSRAPNSEQRPFKDNRDKLNAKEGYAIHLSSYSNTRQMKDSWKTIKAQYSQLLHDKTPLSQVVKVNTSTFYSLRIGPFLQEDASRTCNQIKSDGAYCGVVSYSGDPI